MPRLDIIPDSQRIKEGAILREIWLEYKRKHNGISQDRFCAENGINQGQFQRWLSGGRQIPAHRLTKLATIMGFNAQRVRPSAQQIAEDWNAATNAAVRDLPGLWSQLSPAQQEEALRYMDLLVRAGDRSADE